ncbi:hypothetical protein [Kitasatospora sp. NPDC056731]|uniref:hypothetical protein n=1 Tax=Kitasatospora sp. NPDC056731 TaxID=3155422 RepID=UPI00342CEA04
MVADKTDAAGADEVTEEPGEAVERVAAIDIAKASGMVRVRVPHDDGSGRRVQRVFHAAATSGAILDLADHLVCQGVARVVMEATSTYWKPWFFLLEARGLDCWLVNARDVKNVPGRRKPTSSTRYGWPSSPNAACSGARSCPRSPSANCGT